jgi:hypothetical protein
MRMKCHQGFLSGIGYRELGANSGPTSSRFSPSEDLDEQLEMLHLEK